MRMLRINQTAIWLGMVGRNITLAMITVAIGVTLCIPLVAQDIKFQKLSIDKTEQGFVVKGEVEASSLNDVGIVESDDVAIFADIKENAGSQFQLLPKSMFIRFPPGAETAYTEGSGLQGTMTKLEYYGKDIKAKNIASFSLRNTPVWRAYGGLKDWKENAPATVSKEFEGNIPLEFAGKALRIRATLTHRWGGPYANWPAMSFHHDIGYEGILQGEIAIQKNQPIVKIDPPVKGEIIDDLVEPKQPGDGPLTGEQGEVTDVSDPKPPQKDPIPHQDDPAPPKDNPIPHQDYVDDGKIAEIVNQQSGWRKMTPEMLRDYYKNRPHTPQLTGIDPGKSSINSSDKVSLWGIAAQALTNPADDLPESLSADLAEGKFVPEQSIDRVEINTGYDGNQYAAHWKYIPLAGKTVLWGVYKKCDSTGAAAIDQQRTEQKKAGWSEKQYLNNLWNKAELLDQLKKSAEGK